jgi:hypothetical protein
MAPKKQPRKAALAIVYRRIDALAPYEKNARTHSDEQVAQIAASIKEFGWTNPILIDETGSVIAGHGRLMAARSMGMDEVPTITLSGLSDTQRRALILADNKLGLNAGWDDDLLKIELTELSEANFDLGITGFSTADMALLFPEPAKERDASSRIDGMKFQIVVECEDEEHQVDLLGRIEALGISCRALIS